MRCIDCRAEFKKKELSSTSNHCPGCGHQVVARPDTDGISDTKVNRLIAKLAGADQAPVYPEHLAYALMDATKTPGVARRVVFPLAVGVAAIGIFAQIWWLSGVAFIVGVICLIFRGGPPGYGGLLNLATRFYAVNPPLSRPDSSTTYSGTTALDQTLGSSCRRILICANQRYANFLHDAEFTLQNACPVIGPALDFSQYAGLEQHLKEGSDVTVIVIRDFTPAGLSFAERLPDYLRERPHFHEVGLNESFVTAFKKKSRATSEFRGNQTAVSEKVGNRAVELFAIAPAVALTLVATSLDSFAMVPPAEESGASFDRDIDSE